MVNVQCSMYILFLFYRPKNILIFIYLYLYIFHVNIVLILNSWMCSSVDWGIGRLRGKPKRDQRGGGMFERIGLHCHCLARYGRRTRCGRICFSLVLTCSDFSLVLLIWLLLISCSSSPLPPTTTTVDARRGIVGMGGIKAVAKVIREHGHHGQDKAHVEVVKCGLSLLTR